MRYTHFANNQTTVVEYCIWKVRLLFNAMNGAAGKFFEKSEYVCVDESMAKYLTPHPLKQFLRGKPARFGFKVWVLAPWNGEMIRCEPYGGAKRKLLTTSVIDPTLSTA